MWSDRTFCQCFLSRDTRKLTDKCTFWASSSGVMLTCPTATDKHKTFFIWNLMVLLTSSIFCAIDSEWARRPGNLPALLRPGPSKRGICLMSDSEARKASYFLASFFTNFLFLLSFFRASASMYGTSLALASSQCCWSPRMQTCILGRGMNFNLGKMTEVRRLSGKNRRKFPSSD